MPLFPLESLVYDRPTQVDARGQPKPRRCLRQTSHMFASQEGGKRQWRETRREGNKGRYRISKHGSCESPQRAGLSYRLMAPRSVRGVPGRYQQYQLNFIGVGHCLAKAVIVCSPTIASVKWFLKATLWPMVCARQRQGGRCYSAGRSVGKCVGVGTPGSTTGKRWRHV
jgi:hypothetical protein